jgi:NAD(P)H-dependent nitrite reductase small subunit
MNDRDWTPITAIENIPPRQGRSVCVSGAEIAVFNLNGRYLTIDNECPHKGGPLCDGIVSGTTVVCPLHGRHYDLETGLGVRASEATSVTTYPTRVENGVILVNLAASHRFDEAVTG